MVGLFSIGELAALCGVSVRALRLYEDAGLLKPPRTEAGRRVYRAEDVDRLRQVLALKKAGCTLVRIGQILAQRQLDPIRLLDAQIASLEQQRQAMDHTLGALKAARHQIAESKPLTVEELCNLIKLGECHMTQEHWSRVYDRYYTPEEQEQWKLAKTRFTDQDQQACADGWADLIARVEAAMAQGVQPGDPRALGLVKEWYDLQKPMVEAVGARIWNKGATMYAEMDDWQTETVKSPFSKAVFDFIGAAAVVARDQGIIPPRVAA